MRIMWRIAVKQQQTVETNRVIFLYLSCQNNPVKGVIGMPKVLMAYFSQGGTTAKVAQCIAAGLRAEGFLVDFHDIREGILPDPSGYSLLGVGSPVYACRTPFNVSDYIRSLPELNGLPAFSFNLYGTYPADAGRQLRKLLADRGTIDMGYFSARGPEYNLGYLQKGYLFSPDNPTKEELEQAEAFGCEVAGRVLTKGQTPDISFHSPPFVYRFERMMCARWMVKNAIVRTYKVDEKTCNSCGLCMKLCPNHNIREDKEGHPKWGRNCIACLYCEMKCPRDAISSMIDKLGIMWTYNVRHMSADKSLQYVRVRHSRGRAERIA
jgi:flavodoxin/Pyruvate/2-oxoacid:ferredoxin oxidoreductase delta subunit